MWMFLEKHEFFSTILFLAFVAIAAFISYLWLEKTRQEEDELVEQDAKRQPEPFIERPTDKCRVTLASIEKLIGSIMAVVALITAWFLLGALWTMLFVVVVAGVVVWLTGHRIIAVSIVVVVFSVAGLWEFTSWAFSTFHKQPVATIVNIPESEGKPFPTNQGNQPGSGAGPGAEKSGQEQKNTTDNAGTGGTNEAPCDDESIANAAPAAINGLAQPVVFPRPTKQPCEKKSADVAIPIQIAPVIEYEPVTGKRGSDFDIQLRSLGGCTIHSRTVSCPMYVMNFTPAPRELWLDVVDGTDDQGVHFKALATDKNLLFLGGGYTEELQPGVKTRFMFTFRRTEGINQITFTLRYSFDGFHKYEEYFEQIPVAL